MISLTRVVVTKLSSDHIAKNISGEVVAICNNEEEAKNCIRNDIESFIDSKTSDTGDCYWLADFEEMKSFDKDDSDTFCIWDFHTVSINLTKEEVFNIYLHAFNNRKKFVDKIKAMGKEFKTFLGRCKEIKDGVDYD